MASVEIDENLYSRQLYVLGSDAMQNLSKAKVLIFGLDGLGIEIAKDVVLAGVRLLSIHDPTDVTVEDLSSNFFLRDSDIGIHRDVACLKQLNTLNPYVDIDICLQELCENVLDEYSVVVLTNSDLDQQLQFGDYCHKNGIKLIVASAAGLCGQIFCDFGAEFLVSEVSDSETTTSKIMAISREERGVVVCFDETPHSLHDGSFVTFSDIQGMTELNGCEPVQVEVINSSTFYIGDTIKFSNYVQGGICKEIKMPKMFEFKPLREAFKKPDFVQSDFGKWNRPLEMHVLFHALELYRQRYRSQHPRPWNTEDADRFCHIVEEVRGSFDQAKASHLLPRELCMLFAQTAYGRLPPLQSAIGAIAAQEVLKASTHKFKPIRQWFYMDALECLSDPEICAQRGGSTLQQSRYQGQLAVFGEEFQQRIANLKYFMVGAGAIGCELLKNFALMGVGSGENGKVFVTDMDHIERSNLNRQFLFRAEDIEKPKSTVAAKAAKDINPELNIEAHENRVGVETEDIYNDHFFEALDGVVNALDNIPARKYVNDRCVFHWKPMLDSGTMGTRANVQVVLPGLTQTYTNSSDGSRDFIAVCTLKHFPFAIEHTIQWARDTFVGLFANPAQTGLSYLENRDAFWTRVRSLPIKDAVEMVNQLKSVLADKPSTFEDCLVWARRFWQDCFVNRIEQILHNFPANHLLPSGFPFWSGVKHCPHSLEFDVANESHFDFVFSAALLRAKMFNVEVTGTMNRDRVKGSLTGITVAGFQPKDVRIPVSEDEVREMEDSIREVSLDEAIQEIPIAALQDNQVVLSSLEFEKDDDLHIDFVCAAANLRAENYDIVTVERLKAKQIAGRIIPAIATTTSLVAGLVCLELYKVVMGHKQLQLFKNHFSNMAVSFFSFVQPLAPQTRQYNGIKFTVWDCFEITRRLTLREFLAYFKEKHGLDVVSIGHGPYLVYASYMSETRLSERIDMEITALVETISEKRSGIPGKALALELDCEGEDDMKVPWVKYYPRGE